MFDEMFDTTKMWQKCNPNQLQRVRRTGQQFNTFCEMRDVLRKYYVFIVTWLGIMCQFNVNVLFVTLQINGHPKKSITNK